MLTPADFLHLPYTADLTEGGIAYALRTVSRNNTTYNRMRRIVAGVAVELAFRRHLSQQNIPYEIAASMPLAEHNRHDVLLDNRRCDIKSFFISYRRQILQMRRNPEALLGAPALVPSDIDAGEGHSDNDLYIFAFVAGLKATLPRDIKKVIETNQPHYFVHVMPERWRNPAHWNPLGALTLKSEADEPIAVEISGENEARDFCARVINLPPKKKIGVDDSFYSISSIHIKENPTARLGIIIQNKTHIIAPVEWENIWVYGLDILLAGFIARGEYRRRAKYIPAKTQVFQYNKTRVKNLAVPIASLKPLHDLFDRARG
ncbi:MAG: hypothetical protein PHQ36_10775 [Anaerolineales bacterium]|nr:hypothetical protein [Anaerolineales bacterium]